MWLMSRRLLGGEEGDHGDCEAHHGQAASEVGHDFEYEVLAGRQLLAAIDILNGEKTMTSSSSISHTFDVDEKNPMKK